MFIYPTERKEIEKGALNQLEIIDYTRNSIIFVSLLRSFILQKERRRSFRSIGNHRFTFLPLNLKIFVSFKYRLYSKIDYIRIIIVHLSYRGRGEGVLDQLEIIDFCFPSRKFLFPSNIIDYIRIITKMERWRRDL